MDNWMKRTAWMAVLVCMVFGPISQVLLAADAPEAEPTKAAPDPHAAAKRSPEEILRELQATKRQVSEALDSPDAIINPKRRAEVAPKVMAPMKKMVALFEEMGTTQRVTKEEVELAKDQLVPLLALMDDLESV